jgi:hypothetical protein
MVLIEYQGRHGVVFEHNQPGENSKYKSLQVMHRRVYDYWAQLQ